MYENDNSLTQKPDNPPGSPASSPDQDLILAEESAHLEGMKVKLSEALEAADRVVTQMEEEYKDLRFYMSENRSQIDPHEMFQAEMSLHQTDDAEMLAVRHLNKMKKLSGSPYFARIDFAEEGNEAIPYYIGQFSFRHDHKVLISDWRAPVSTLFYDGEVGKAAFTAPKGEVEGELIRKRQFKIKDGTMEYALESSIQIQDDVLQKELSHTSDEKMKSIISTIQKEQNKIIRDENTDTMIIQGVAGSGKTSIALHRIAYLLYRFKETLTAKNITIISPNKVFGDYISNVLPELGEEPVYEMSFADIADVQLEYVYDYEPDKDPLSTTDSGWIERSQFKSTMEFVKLMDEYISDLPERVFTATDIDFEEFHIPADWIQGRYDVYKRFPVMKRLEVIGDDVQERILTENIREYKMPTRRSVMSRLKKMLKFKSTLQIYKQFYKDIGKPKMFQMVNFHTLEWNDVYPFLYLHAAVEGVKESRKMKHIVIDEMQDYTPIQYAVIGKLFDCPKTILGDYSQFIHPFQKHSLEDMRSLYPESQLMLLNKSYRSTYEIIQFAKQFKPGVDIDVIERHGDVPDIISCGDKEEELQKIRQYISNFANTDFASLGIIAKSNKAAAELFEKLSDIPEVNLISPDSKKYVNGISVVSVQMAKGLEFDAVVIPDSGKNNYSTDYDQSLMYVACTRAMHKLTLIETWEA